MIHYSGFDEGFSHKHSRLLVYIKKLFEEESKTKEMENVHVFDCDSLKINSLKNNKNILISPENIYFPYISGNHKKIYKIYRLKEKFKIFFTFDLNALLYVTFKILNLLFMRNKYSIMRPMLVQYVYDIKNKNNGNNYAIISNNVKGKNILNFPYFFHSHFDLFQEFIAVKKEKKYRKKTKFCAFIVGNPMSKDRINFCLELSKYKAVDCYGSVLHNKEIPQELIKKYKNSEVSLEEALRINHYSHVTDSYRLNQELFRDYKFVICFENSYAYDYITEKLPNVMLANAIGVYKGAPNIDEFFNTKSFLNYDDYGNNKVLINKIMELDQDDGKYETMLDELFFMNNELPLRVKKAKEELTKFLLKIIK